MINNTQNFTTMKNVRPKYEISYGYKGDGYSGSTYAANDREMESTVKRLLTKWEKVEVRNNETGIVDYYPVIPFIKFMTDYHIQSCENYNNTSRDYEVDKSYFEGKKIAAGDLLERFKRDNFVAVPAEILENVIKYCEEQAIYDKLSKYGDFYYKLNSILKEKNQ